MQPFCRAKDRHLPKWQRRDLMANKVAFLCAGGTGGHLFPAEALSAELVARGWTTHLLTDTRAERFVSGFPAERIHRIPSATIAGSNPITLIISVLALARGTFRARALAKELAPAIAVGFGGYPSLPPVLGAQLGGVPTLIHEQNAVPGRANRLLARFVTGIAGGFLGDAVGPYSAKTITTGNPVRPPVIEAAKVPFEAPKPDEPFQLLVFGGSQGAQYFSTAIPAAIALLPQNLRKRLAVTQQARPDDIDLARNAYAALGMQPELAPFFSDMPQRIAKAHFVISRSGASTVSEIAAIGRPALLVPYPHALDHDQAANAAKLADTGGVEVAKQDSLTAENLSARLIEAMNKPDGLTQKAKAAKSAGRANAAILLADLVEAMATGKSVAAFKADLKG
jgi:UDP-N-acetylglucosamine--N-acetylmuramyl-(pentapeptide) pyrophosphoryl-undecaprenol N-acetylglucosamine transferase